MLQVVFTALICARSSIHAVAYQAQEIKPITKPGEINAQRLALNQALPVN